MIGHRLTMGKKRQKIHKEYKRDNRLAMKRGQKGCKVRKSGMKCEDRRNMGGMGKGAG